MDQNELFAKNARDYEKNLHEFIDVEVKTSLTFAGIALTTNDEQQRQEDTVNARTGYDKLLHFIAEAREKFPDHPIAASSLEGLAKLKQTLEQLGEHL